MNTCKRMVLSLFMGGIIVPGLIGQAPENMATDLARIQDNATTRRISSFDLSGGNNDRFENIRPGETKTLFEVEGAGIINHIWITIAPGPDVLSRNNIILRMYWDGNDEPSVHSPIGPFFGQGWEETYNYSSLFLSAGPVEGRGLVCYFAMPFEKGARIEIVNENDRKIDAFYYYIDYAEMEKLPEGLGRFHAWYNHELTEALPEGENEWGTISRETGVETGRNIDGKSNYLIADINGRGHYVGVNYYVHSPSPIWYGEGDDMFFIDGDQLPSLNGTGTEDYFNTSWCPKEPFNHAWYGYARLNDDVGWLGRTHVYRFHVTDPVYFNKNLRFSIEHGHNNNLTLDLSSVAYWYLDRAGAVPGIPGIDERKPKPLITHYDMHIWRHYWREDRGAGTILWGNEPK